MDLMKSFRLDRRKFIGTSAGAISAQVVVRYLGGDEAQAAPPKASNSDKLQQLDPGPSWSGESFRAKRRYDGLAKVTGSKVYGRDLHARDLDGWPHDEIRVMILRVGRADRIFKGVAEAALKRELKVQKVVTHADFARDKLNIPFYFGRLMLARMGSVPDYLGQPAALLYFDREDFLDMAPRLIDMSAYLEYGDAAPLRPSEAYGATRITRYAEGPEQDTFSLFQDGPYGPSAEQADAKGSANARAAYYGQKIGGEIAHQGWKVFKGEFKTQSVDPCFMESESGLAWLDRSQQALHLALGTQSPYEDGEACAVLFSDKTCPHKVKTVQLNCCYPGGGFGGRDHSDFPLYLAMAAVYADGKPVRIVYSRFDQFQAGIKRHAATVTETLAVDDHGVFQALTSDIVLDGGGQNNFSFAVQAVAAQNATAAYYLPRLDIVSKASSSSAVTAGSMRGFGTLQAMFALETLVDEAAAHLQMDAIDLRLKNLLSKAKKTSMGGTPTYAIQSDKLLLQAKANPLWRDRDKLKKERSNDGELYGVGFALACKSYGTNLDACLAAVSIAEDGRTSIKCNGIDMGNGAATTLSLAVADILGRSADTIKLGVTEEFNVLQLVASFEGSQKDEDTKAKNSRWVPYLSMSTAASCSAYQMRHAVREAAKIVLRHGLWPAAVSKAKLADKTFRPERIQWLGEQLVIDQQHRLAYADVIKQAYRDGHLTGAMVHTYYRSAWAKADFKIAGASETLAIDALAVKRGKATTYTRLDRERVAFPPFRNNLLGVDMFTPYGLLLAVRINKKSGEVKIDEAHGYLDCGPVIQPEIVDGQAAGALVMGMGQALYEDLPLTTGGPGEGGWNFGRYRVPTMRDVPYASFQLHLIEPVAGDPPKGMAEVVECAVIPGIANAIHHAIGHRFRELPITADKILKVLV